MDKDEEKRTEEAEAMRKKTGESRIEPVTDDQLEIENGFFTVGEDEPLIKVNRDEEEESAESD